MRRWLSLPVFLTDPLYIDCSPMQPKDIQKAFETNSCKKTWTHRHTPCSVIKVLSVKKNRWLNDSINNKLSLSLGNFLQKLLQGRPPELYKPLLPSSGSFVTITKSREAQAPLSKGLAQPRRMNQDNRRKRRFSRQNLHIGPCAMPCMNGIRSSTKCY